MWITARGRFIFTDCVVKNRAAIAEPWREYRREGNSFFLFMVAVAFVGLLVTAVLVLIIAVPLGLFSDYEAATEGFGAVAIIAIIVLGLIWLVVSLFVALISQFMVPVMYRRRCLAKDAFLDVTKLILRYPGEFVLLVLFAIVLAIAVELWATPGLMTCCIGGLPYISRSALRYVWVFLQALCLRASSAKNMMLCRRRWDYRQRRLRPRPPPSTAAAMTP